MRHFFYLFLLPVAIFACNSATTQQAHAIEQSVQPLKECPPGEDTINLITTFIKDTAKTSTDQLYSIVRFISDKGFFRPGVNKNGRLKIKKESVKTFPVAYDTCDMKRWITKNFIMENIQVTALDFIGTGKDRYTGFTPILHFEEWQFAGNTDRDSAMKIVQTVYTYPNNIVMYEKRYSQFIIDDKRIYLLEAGAKFAEPYVIEYKKLVEQFIRTNHNNR